MREMRWQIATKTADWSETRRPPMPAYLVRLVKNRDLVGFFAADDFDDLVTAVDECTDVPGCEYIELPAGGIMWTSPAIPVPVSVPEDEKVEMDELPWARAEMSERWWDVVYGYTDDEWTRFDPDAPQDPAPAPPKRPLGPARVIPIRPRKGSG
jgi:hypothetical protein